MSVPRPFRAIAYVPDPTGQETGRSRRVAGRVAAKSRAGLQRFLDEQASLGHPCDVHEVLDMLDEIPPDDTPR